MEIVHETLVFERSFHAPPERLFKAFSDPREREIWSAPSETVEVRIDSSSFQTGGRESARCGPKGKLNWTMDVAYHLVVHDSLISFTEVLSEGDQVLTVALITVEIGSQDHGSQLRLTDQITSFVGDGGVSGHREGYTQTLANLEVRLSET